MITKLFLLVNTQTEVVSVQHILKQKANDQRENHNLSMIMMPVKLKIIYNISNFFFDKLKKKVVARQTVSSRKCGEIIP